MIIPRTLHRQGSVRVQIVNVYKGLRGVAFRVLVGVSVCPPDLERNRPVDRASQLPARSFPKPPVGLSGLADTKPVQRRFGISKGRSGKERHRRSVPPSGRLQIAALCIAGRRAAIQPVGAVGAPVGSHNNPSGTAQQAKVGITNIRSKRANDAAYIIGRLFGRTRFQRNQRSRARDY